MTTSKKRIRKEINEEDRIIKVTSYVKKKIYDEMKKHNISPTESLKEGVVIQKKKLGINLNPLTKEHLKGRLGDQSHRIGVRKSMIDESIKDLKPIRTGYGFSIIDPHPIKLKGSQIDRPDSDIQKFNKDLFDQFVTMEELNKNGLVCVFDWKGAINDFIDKKLNTFEDYFKLDRFEVLKKNDWHFDEPLFLRTKQGHEYLLPPDPTSEHYQKNVQIRADNRLKSQQIRAEREAEEKKKAEFLKDYEKQKQEEAWQKHKKEQEEIEAKQEAEKEKLLIEFRKVDKRIKKINEMVSRSKDKSRREKLLAEKETLKEGVGDTMNKLVGLGYVFPVLNWDKEEWSIEEG